MKRIVLVVVVASIIACNVVIAQGMGQGVKDMQTEQKQPTRSMKDMPMGTGSTASTHKATGIVRKVDPARSTVTVDHEAVASLKWPAMTMDFEVADKKMLDNLKPGTKVQFELREKSNGKYVVTAMKP